MSCKLGFTDGTIAQQWSTFGAANDTTDVRHPHPSVNIISLSKVQGASAQRIGPK